ncbi:MAG: RHS repeat-associated core domain-containing protein [Anaerolineales bacterium]
MHRTSFGAVQVRINSTLYYTLKDQLGSASVVTDASGNILGENRYYPFGETRITTGTIFTDKLFTGQREMAGLGIYHYGARFYSPKLGRFLSPDTIVPGYANPQNLNRFSYVTNNPLRYTDPTGHMQASDSYTESDGVCDPGDTSCNWVGQSPKPKPKPKEEENREEIEEIREGSIHGSVRVIPGSEIRDSKLATKAEESYTGWGGSGEVPFNPFGASDVLGVASDFAPPNPNSYPITISLNWHSNESGMHIEDFQVNNYSPTAVVILGAMFTDNPRGVNPIIMNGSSDFAGTNGDVSMSVQATVNLPISIRIQLQSIGGFPEYPSFTIQLQDFPPSGDSLWP